MLQEHKEALIREQDVKEITKRLDREEQERHQQRVKDIANSERQAILFYECLVDKDAGEAGTIARAYVKTWAAKLGIDLDELRKQKEKDARQLHELMKVET